MKDINIDFLLSGSSHLISRDTDFSVTFISRKFICNIRIGKNDFWLDTRTDGNRQTKKNVVWDMETLPLKCKPVLEKVVEVLIDGLRTFNTFSFRCDLDSYVNDVLSDLEYFSPCKACRYNKICIELLKNEVYAAGTLGSSSRFKDCLQGISEIGIVRERY